MKNKSKTIKLGRFSIFFFLTDHSFTVTFDWDTERIAHFDSPI